MSAVETVRLYGIRHHGPGSARSLLHALQSDPPDCLLIEGPPEVGPLLALAGSEDMVPPVALLVHAVDEPERAVFYPFAVYSPEWQAMRFALAREIPVEFIDLAIAHKLALEKEQEEARAAEEARREERAVEVDDDDDRVDVDASEDAFDVDEATPSLSSDPLYYLARAAGFSDGERWWESMVETRQSTDSIFEGIAEAMAALRAEVESEPTEVESEFARRREQLREAAMRTAIRDAQKRGHERIAVVCGAWHVPALAEMPSVTADRKLLTKLPKVKVDCTWVPWTHERLALASGYGAGVTSPAWYHHLWTGGAVGGAVGWLARAARIFRDREFDVSSAHIIDAARLAETLAAMRERPVADLDDLTEAIQSVYLGGASRPLRLVADELWIGPELGRVPADTPAAPLARDLAQHQRSLRLKPQALEKERVLDLRKPMDRERSRLLRALALLEVDWGRGGQRGRGKGTFKEVWTLRWDPGMEVQLVDAGRWGNTVFEAASRRSIARSLETEELSALTALTRDVLFAGLESAVESLVSRLQVVSTLTTDVLHLLASFPDLVQLMRYGDVRGTDASLVGSIAGQILTRASIGLPKACTSIDDEAAAALTKEIQGAHRATALLRPNEGGADSGEVVLSDEVELWVDALRRTADRPGVHGRIAGRVCRLLQESGGLSSEEVSIRMARELSRGADPAAAAAWLEGFLAESGQVLVHDPELLRLIDGWVVGQPEESFLLTLPLVRRTFATFTGPERRQIGRNVERSESDAMGGRPSEGPGFPRGFDVERARATLPRLREILGIEEGS